LVSTKLSQQGAAAEATRVLITGNEAIGWGAIYAGCIHYFGYPITPQNELTEFFARELPKIGGEFIQAESEFAAISMVYGAAACGVRAMTTTSSPGFSLMGEGLSAIAAAEMPCLVVDVQRGGPGLGTTQTAQTDYLQATKGGGHGGYHNIVLAPASAQEMFDFTQLAFYLADKYRHHVLMLTDGILGQMMESVELKALDFGPLPAKDWALRGIARKGGRNSVISSLKVAGMAPELYGDYLLRINEKYQAMEENEVRCETYRTEDADLVLVAYGSSARIAMEAVDEARAEGRRVGVFRPLTLWPFPKRQVRALADQVSQFLVVEDSLGQMVEDVRAAVAERAPVHLLGILARDDKGGGGMILPGRVLQEVRELT